MSRQYDVRVTVTKVVRVTIHYGEIRHPQMLDDAIYTRAENPDDWPEHTAIMDEQTDVQVIKEWVG